MAKIIIGVFSIFGCILGGMCIACAFNIKPSDQVFGMFLIGIFTGIAMNWMGSRIKEM